MDAILCGTWILRVHTAHKRSQKVCVNGFQFFQVLTNPKISVPIPRSVWTGNGTKLQYPFPDPVWTGNGTKPQYPFSSPVWTGNGTKPQYPFPGPVWTGNEATHYIHSTSSYPSFGHAQFRGGDHGIHMLAADLGSECRLLAVGDKPIHNLTRTTEQRDNLMWSLWRETRTKR